MAGRLDQHGSEKFSELFDEDTGEPGSLGEIVDKHAGDAIFLAPEDNRPAKGADGGYSDIVGEMLPSDPDDFYEEGDDDLISGDAIAGVDITGTAPGLARGFGSHVPLDLGAGGFQIENIPDRALPHVNRPLADEELDDYDDDDPGNGKYDPKDLETLSIPGSGTHDEDSDLEE
jgi:hypothetical protein